MGKLGIDKYKELCYTCFQIEINNSRGNGAANGKERENGTPGL